MNRKTKFGLLIIALAWYFNDPISRGFSDPWKLKRQNAGFKLVRQVLSVADYLGLYPMGQGFQNLVRLTAKEVPIPDGLHVEDAAFDGVTVRLYKPKVRAKDPKGFPALVYYHGGGWTVGSVPEYDKHMFEMCRELDIVAISVEYRMAPEFKFPAPLEDCVKVTKYVFANAKTLGINPDRVAVGGDSAGGNLAAAVPLKLRDDNFSPMPKLQLLIYPALQAMDFSVPSYTQNKHGPVLTDYWMAWFWSMYISGSNKYTSAFLNNEHTSPAAKKDIYWKFLGHENLPKTYHYKPYQKPVLDHGRQEIWDELRHVLENPYLAPLVAEDVSRLPAAFVYTAQYDVLRDDGLFYVQRLQAGGVDVTHVHGTQTFHGIFTFFDMYKEGAACMSDIVGFLRKRL